MSPQPQHTLLQRYTVSATVKRLVSSPRLMYIDGDWVSAEDGTTLDVLEPSTGEFLVQIPDASKIDVDRAVNAAARAFRSVAWQGLTPYDRQQLLLRLADLIEQHADDFAQLESIDNGKAVSVARAADVEGVIRFFRYMAGWATKLEGTTKHVSAPGQHFTYTLQEPVGVVAGIVPWNFPLSMAAWKIAPALATGCTVVLKPSEVTPLTALLLAELAEQAGIPAGVFNVITGTGAKAGQALTSHPLVNKVAFTGSTAVGKAIGHSTIDNMTRVSLELGGKSPVIVMADADIEIAAQGAADAIFFNQGQVCCAGSRLYVHERIYEKFVAEVALIADKLHLAPGLDPQCEMGPLVSQAQFDKVTRYIDIGLNEGAELASGGASLNRNGYFVKPTVLANTNNAMRVVREEIFGPVLCAQPFSSTEEVIGKANDSEFGLGASIWSKDLSLVHNMIPQIQAGTVWVNTHNVVDACLPFGGVKQSGYGREQGHEQLANFLETKSVWINL